MKSRGEKWYLITRSSFTLHVCPSSDMAPSEDAVSAWSCNQVAQWLQEEGFGDYVELLCTQHRLDGLSLLALTEADLRGPPLGLTVLGDIKRMTIALRRLQRQNQSQLEELGLGLADSLPAGLSVSTAEVDWSCDGADGRYTRGGHSCNRNGLRQRNGERPGYASGASLCHMHSNGRCRQHLAGRLDPEVWKTVISSFYVFFVFGFTSFVMVIVHERVPDMRTYPPLPDIFLDRYRFLHASTRCATVCCRSYVTHSSFCTLTVFPEFLGRLQWLKPVASSCVTCFCWFCSFTNTGRAPLRFFPSWTQYFFCEMPERQSCFHPEHDLWMFVCVLGPSSSDGCVLWWELCFCFAAALCLSLLSLCLVNTSSAPVRWEPHMRWCADHMAPVCFFNAVIFAELHFFPWLSCLAVTTDRQLPLSDWFTAPISCLQTYDDTLGKIQRALTIWSGFGMTLTGVQTCGDYMFSGHTVVITMLNFFVTECECANTSTTGMHEGGGRLFA